MMSVCVKSFLWTSQSALRSFSCPKGAAGVTHFCQMHDTPLIWFIKITLILCTAFVFNVTL
jgi:hypothetical protein